MGRDRRIRWLHLSDFHQGVNRLDQKTEVPELLRRLLSDLEILHRDGPIDLVLFTGDLTQSGEAKQFEALGVFLDMLIGRLRELGSEPVLLAVPGNHDLVRPDGSDMAAVVFDAWEKNPKVQDAFWDSESKNYVQYHKPILTAFANYRSFAKAWLKKHPLPAWVEVRANGFLPGDFGATIEKNGAKLFVAGLNSAFLQLGDGYYKGRLELSPRQLIQVAGQRWEESHDAALLLSHHPPDWLNERSLQGYKSLLIQRERFAAHLYGHMHEPQVSQHSEGGGSERFRIQAASLWSRDRFGKDSHETRLHGYSVGQMDLDDGLLRLWPREYVEKADGEWRFEPDNRRYYLHSDGQLQRPVSMKRLRPPPVVVPISGVAPVGDASLRGSSSDPALAREAATEASLASVSLEHYVVRERLELPLRRYLRGETHNPVVLWGPAFCGKKTLLRHVLSDARSDEAKRGRKPLEVLLDFANFRLEHRDHLDGVLRGMALRIARAVSQRTGEKDYAQWVKARFEQHDHIERLNWLLEEDIFPRLQAGLSLVLLSANLLLHSPLGAEVFGMLRHWADCTQQSLHLAGEGSPSWLSLRLVTVISTMESPQEVIHGSQFLNHAERIDVDDFSRDELLRLIRSYEKLPGAEVATDALLQVVGGQPNLLRRILDDASRIGVLQLDREYLQRVCLHHLESVRQWIRRSPELDDAVQRLLRGGQLTPMERQRLLSSGLSRNTPSGLKLRYPLYEDYLREQR
jgi:predicted MPP superfamily phosphohydrolase